MTGSASTEVGAGDMVLMPTGPALVSHLERHGICVVDVAGTEQHIGWERLSVRGLGADGKPEAVHTSLEPRWSGLTPSQRDQALLRLEVVLEIRTGFRSGHHALARVQEPYYPFGEGYGATMTKRLQAMSQQLQQEREHARASGDLETSRVTRLGGSAVRTLSTWLSRFDQGGLLGLVDARGLKGRRGFDRVDPAIVQAVDQELRAFDGSVSRVNIVELERRVRSRLRSEGLTDLEMPQRLIQQYLSVRYRALGATTRSHKSAGMRRRRGHASHPDTHPGHLAVDVTRADGLVRDDLHGRPYSVEIISIISVPTRVIVACRVVPRSANAVEVGLALYDAMRPFSMHVKGTTVDDFRWCGIAASLDFSPRPITDQRPRLKTDRALDGTHIKPAVTPKSIRADNGSVFVSTHLRSVLTDMGVDLLTSRVGHPTDNAHIERWHETLQRAYQQIPGFKGRNVQERGRFVGTEALEPLLTARELEQHLHRFIALDYHRNQHDGIQVPGLEGAHLTPLERFDMLSSATGRIMVPQHPDLVFDFLPIRWLTPGNAGVEYRGLTYDGPVMDELTGVAPRTFRDRDDKIPFFYDPHDRTRLWHRSRRDGRIYALRWRESHLVEAPLTDVVVQRARQLVADRGGNAAVSRRATMLEIIDALGELTSPSSREEWRTRLTNARLRHERALLDHAEVDAARQLLAGGKNPAPDAPRGQVLPFPAPPPEDDTDNDIDWDAPLPDYSAAWTE